MSKKSIPVALISGNMVRYGFRTITDKRYSRFRQKWYHICKSPFEAMLAQGDWENGGGRNA